MNKITKLSTITLLSLSLLAGCSDKSDKETKGSSSGTVETVEKKSTEKETAKKETFKPEDVGEGTFNIGSPSGNTADGDEIIIFYKKDTFGQGLSLYVEGFDGSKLTHIFVDGKEIDTEQFSHNQTDVILDSDELGKRSEELTEGEHTIQLVQFSDPDDTSSEPAVVKTQHYIVKDK
ncbi:hypothetical protein [Melissococcus sp. OM08-11BH]|uniref:hypothetical protein n=1 Tax=Melissococcus sp. OM08-11BH TaxID=2293110 RepID=UPI000E492E92|nr:hypothetical protein [Melissococcus sp. OM08-11BH]RGI30861.1 hypothetical protein DXC12_04490 [Melissococcus sp. OM08-11BH]